MMRRAEYAAGAGLAALTVVGSLAVGAHSVASAFAGLLMVEGGFWALEMVRGARNH